MKWEVEEVEENKKGHDSSSGIGIASPYCPYEEQTCQGNNDSKRGSKRKNTKRTYGVLYTARLRFHRV